MTMLHPNALILASLAVPVVLLYLRRDRPRRRSVATGFLWEQVLGPSQGRSAWWRCRRWVSLGVQLAVLAMLVLAVAEPRVRPPASPAAVIDTSAVNAPDARAPDGLPPGGKRPVPAASGPPVWELLAAAALLVVVVEWCLFQRRWTC
jgi:hypothetical protein